MQLLSKTIVVCTAVKKMALP